MLLLHHCSASDEPPTVCLQMGGNVTPDGLPLANRLFNVYQPFDPVAYRWVLLGKMHYGATQTSLKNLLCVAAPLVQPLLPTSGGTCDGDAIRRS